MYFLALLSLFTLISCSETNTPAGAPEASPQKTEANKIYFEGTEDEAKAVIKTFTNNPKTRKFSEINLLWNPKSKAEITAYFSPTTDLGKSAVINMLPAAPIAKALGFYHATNDAGAFANTFESLKDFEYRGQTSKYAELFFQAEKLSQFGKPEYKGDFTKSFNALVALKQNITWPDFIKNIKTLFPTSFDAQAWDSVAVDLMSKIHAARFKAEPDLFLALVSTPARSVIVEDAKAHDVNWGNGGDGNGNNKLGLLYMTHRQRFWFAFKTERKEFFKATNAEHVAWMLKWLNNYDGTTTN